MVESEVGVRSEPVVLALAAVGDAAVDVELNEEVRDIPWLTIAEKVEEVGRHGLGGLNEANPRTFFVLQKLGSGDLDLGLSKQRPPVAVVCAGRPCCRTLRPSP